MTLCAVSAGPIFASQVHAYTQESFEYPAGEAFIGGEGGKGWGGAWTTTSGVPTNFNIQAESLSYASGDKKLATSGGAAVITGASDRAWRLVDLKGKFASLVDAKGLIGKPGKTLWGSFLVQRPQAPNGRCSVTLQSSGGAAIIFDFDAKDTRVRLPSYNHRASGSPGTLDPEKPALMLFRVQFGDVQNETRTDTVTLWLNPTVGGDQPDGKMATVSTTADATGLAFDTVQVRHLSPAASVAKFDEVRLGLTYDEVMPVAP